MQVLCEECGLAEGCRVCFGGFTGNRACVKIYSVYGASCAVSEITKGLIKDKKNGGHNSLRIEMA